MRISIIRISIVAILGTTLLATVGPALAASDSDWTDCFATNADRSIAACTHIVNDVDETMADRSIAFYRRGNAYHDKRDDQDRAIGDYSAAIRLDPDSARAHVARGDAYRIKSTRSDAASSDRKRYALFAAADFTDAMELTAQPTARDFVNRSNAYALLSDYSDAMNDLDTALRLDPADSNSARVNRCSLHGLMGKLDAALADCTAYLHDKRNARDTANALETRGRIYLRMAKFDDGLADFNKAVKLRGHVDTRERSSAMIGRGIAKLHKGDQAGGEADIAAGKKIDPAGVTIFAGLM